MKTISSQRAKSGNCKLTAEGWNSETRAALQKLIRKGKGKGLAAVFDFDNTVQHGDIQEATLGMLASSGLLTPARLSDRPAPSFRTADRGMVELHACEDILDYYKELLTPTAHGKTDPTPLSTGYAWAIEVMGGLEVMEVVQATQRVCEMGRTDEHAAICVPPGKTSIPVPRFYPEMIELLAQLIRYEFDVWIISASNVWSVRWMVLNELNPRLREYWRRNGKSQNGHVAKGIPADHVIGAATLLTDGEGHLYKDAVLVRENPGYAAMEAAALSPFRLTSHLEYPLPAYSGKVACIFDAIGRKPYLCAGDGPGDHAMMSVSQHRLFIARLGRAGKSPAAAKSVARVPTKDLMIQASRTAPVNGFWGGTVSVNPPEILQRPGSDFLVPP